MFGSKLEKGGPGTMEGRKVEAPGKSTMIMPGRDARPAVSGGDTVESRPMGTMGCQVFEGQAATNALEFTRSENKAALERITRADTLDARLARLGVGSRRRR